jgi:hypothetical protein
MPPSNNPQGPPEPDPGLRARAERFLPGNRDPGFLGGRKPFHVYYDARGRPLTQHSYRFFIPSPNDGETRFEAFERVGSHIFGKVMKVGGALSSDAAASLQIVQASIINDLARISPFGGSMTHSMNQVLAQTLYGLFAPRDRKQYNNGFGNIAMIGEIMALSQAMGHAGGHIAPRGML